jgi:hypothetical protein
VLGFGYGLFFSLRHGGGNIFGDEGKKIFEELV